MVADARNHHEQLLRLAVFFALQGHLSRAVTSKLLHQRSRALVECLVYSELR